MTPQDAELLLGLPEFRSFLFAAIQSAGVLSQEGPANGQTVRDLSYLEGRRSLGFDLLHLAHSGQPEAIRVSDPGALATLNAVILEAMNPRKDNTNGRRSELDRYSDLTD